MIKIGKYANSIGIWDFEVAGIQQDLQPDMDDIRDFRDIMVDPIYVKDRKKKFIKFSDFMFKMIEKSNPDEETATTQEEKNQCKKEIREYVEMNLNELFEEALIAFKWTTREKLKAAQEEEEKKLMSSD